MFVRTCFSAAALAAATTSAHAAILSIDLSVEFSGGVNPLAPPSLLIDDQGTPGSVVVTLDASDLDGNPASSGDDRIKEWYLNLDPSLDPDDLVFSGFVKAGTFDTPSISTAVNAFKADGDGRYDILLAFANGNNNKTFDDGESFTFTISGIPSLVASSFQWLSHPDGGNGPFITAAHVLSVTPSGDSGWVAEPFASIANAPEPASLTLLALGGVALLRRRPDR